VGDIVVAFVDRLSQADGIDTSLLAEVVEIGRLAEPVRNRLVGFDADGLEKGRAPWWA
jgi:hypothetical protein